ncbi:MAG: flavodoxin [Synergistaceae bacterium]|jgi:flavodoxin|nr:flavodoxin [Synergistaceae bacterium]
MKSTALVAYFSWSGSVKALAERIHEEVGGDIFEIAPVEPYPTDYNACIDVAKKEQEAHARPALSACVEDIGRYGVVFLGYPNWWSSIPMPVASFLEGYDFTGKTIAPFCSHGGGGVGRSLSAIAKLAPHAVLTKALVVHDGGAADVSAWLAEVVEE